MVQAEVAAVQQSSGGDAGTSTSLVTVADGLDAALHNGDAVQACRHVNRMQWYACFGAWVLFGPACPRYLARVPHSFGPRANSKHPRVLVFVWLAQASRLAREPPMRPRALVYRACASHVVGSGVRASTRSYRQAPGGARRGGCALGFTY